MEIVVRGFGRKCVDLMKIQHRIQASKYAGENWGIRQLAGAHLDLRNKSYTDLRNCSFREATI